MPPPPQRAGLEAGPVAPVHACRRVRAVGSRSAPALAWREAERPPTPDTRLLLEPPVPPAQPPQRAYGPTPESKSEKRKKKLVQALRPPYFTLSMIAVTVCVHVWGSRDLRTELEWAPDAWRREPWRLLTYGWVHASDAHLALNALVALAVGWRLEREQSAWRVAAVWVGGVAAGALGAGALQPHVRVVGASAAVYALLTAHLSNVCLRFGHVPLWWFRPLSVAVLVLSEGCWALLRPPPLLATPAHALAPPPPHAQVAWAAHVLGAAVGVPLAFLVFAGENSSKRAIVACRVASAALLAAGAAGVVLHYVGGGGPRVTPR